MIPFSCLPYEIEMKLVLADNNENRTQLFPVVKNDKITYIIINSAV